MQEKERNYFLDNIKVLLIFLVVFGHVIEFFINESSVLKGVYIFIYIFHMPVFIFISGYFSKDTVGSKTGAIRNLLMPYIVFNLIWYTAAFFVTKDNLFSLIYPGWTLWYLISLFFWRVSLKYIWKIRGILILSFIGGLLIGILNDGLDILAFSRTIAFLPFFLMGYYCKGKDFRKILKINKTVSIVGVIIFFITSMYRAFNNVIQYRFFYNDAPYSMFGMSIVEGMAMRIGLYLSSIILGIFIINLTPEKKVFYSYIGKNTMNIYVFHIYLAIVIFLLVKTWNNGLIFKIILLLSPIVITYILSFKLFTKLYEYMFYPINRVNSHLFKGAKWSAKKIKVLLYSK